MKLGITLAAALMVSTASLADDYEVDLSHSSVNFKIGHFNFSYTVGRFNDFSGMFSDTKGSESVEIVIKSTSIDTNHEPRDKHLRSPDFFNVKEYPEITFKSTSVTEDKLMGDLTMHGQTKPVTLDLTLVGEGDDPWGNYRKGYSASGVIKRSDWGIDYSVPAIPDEVTLMIEIEGVKK